MNNIDVIIESLQFLCIHSREIFNRKSLNVSIKVRHKYFHLQVRNDLRTFRTVIKYRQPIPDFNFLGKLSQYFSWKVGRETKFAYSTVKFASQTMPYYGTIEMSWRCLYAKIRSQHCVLYKERMPVKYFAIKTNCNTR